MSTKSTDIPVRFISPDRLDPEIGLDLMRQPKWNIPDIVVIKAAVVGGVVKRVRNPNQPYTSDEIRKAAIECIEAGATAVHIHPRTPDGEDVRDKDKYIRNLHLIIDPIKEKYGDRILIDGCTVMTSFEDEVDIIKTGLVEMSPVNPFVFGQISPKKLLQAEAEIMQENGVKPEIAIRCDGDLDRAKDWLIDAGIVAKPLCWLLLPSFTIGCTALPNEFAMAESLMWHVRQIRQIDPESVIMVCMSGRPSFYLGAMAMLLGLHVRVGMEDTYFKWPHKDDIIDRSATVVADTIRLAYILGRRPATADEYRVLAGLPKP